MEKFQVSFLRKFEFTKENINDLMCTALEGGISYWCDEVRIIENPEAVEFTSDVISGGGKLLFYFDGEKDELTLEKFLEGLNDTLVNGRMNYDSAEEFMDDHDADVADSIIQYALFDGIVYG